MLKRLKQLSFQRTYTITEENFKAMCEEIEQEIRKEIQAEYKQRLEELKRKVESQSNYIAKIEKNYSDLSIKTDILKSQLEQVKADKKVIPLNRDLASEIFGSEV